MMTTIDIETTRFGGIQCPAQEALCFPDGLLGFPEAQHYVLIPHKEGSPFVWLQSLDVGDLAFLVVDPSVFVDDYAPEMPDRVATALELTEETPRIVYTIVTIPRGKPEDMTLNLAGPLLINAESRRAVQVVLDTDAYPLKHRILPAKTSDGEAA